MIGAADCVSGPDDSQIKSCLTADRPLPDHDRSVWTNGARGHLAASAIARIRPMSGMAGMHVNADATVVSVHIDLCACRHGKYDRRRGKRRQNKLMHVGGSPLSSSHNKRASRAMVQRKM